MNIYTIDPSLIARGREAFDVAMKNSHDTGFVIVPGAIVAAIEAGHTSRIAIENLVSLVSRCRRSTVRTALNGLSTNRNPNGLWMCDEQGKYRLVDQPIRPFSVMAR